MQTKNIMNFSKQFYSKYGPGGRVVIPITLTLQKSVLCLHPGLFNYKINANKEHEGGYTITR